VWAVRAQADRLVRQLSPSRRPADGLLPGVTRRRSSRLPPSTISNHGQPTRPCVFGLLLVLLALAPLAHAAASDPAWIRGIYHDADFDEVVAAVTSGMRRLPPAIGLVSAQGVRDLNRALEI